MSELTRRILFAVVAAPLAVAVIWLGGAPLAALLSIIAAVSAWEFCRIARAAGADPLDWAAVIAAAAIPLGVHGFVLGVIRPGITTLVLALLALLVLAIFARGPARRPLTAVSTTALGAVYAALIAYVYTLRYHDLAVGAAAGTAIAMLPILLTWATDVGAYAFGRLLGERKLIPSVSPGKTVAGAVGGTLLAIAIALLYVRLVLPPVAQLSMRPATAVAFAVIVAVVAQVGDLVESLFKREAGVKNSSELLPGHGGVLDRVDSLLFVLPVATVLLRSWLVFAPARP